MPKSVTAAHQSLYSTSNTDISDPVGDLETIQLSRRMDGSKKEILYFPILRKEMVTYLKKIIEKHKRLKKSVGLS